MTQPIRVLLVEDNPADAELTRETLEASKIRVQISVASDGVEAMRLLRREPPHGDRELPDLVLLDLNLPKVDGKQVLAEMRQTAALRRIPVVVLTSSDAERDIVRSYELGANCYVTKPVGLEAFQAIVRAVEGFWFQVVKLP